MIALATWMFIAAAQQGPADEICSHHNLPLRGTVRGQRLIGFFGSPKSGTAIAVIPVDNPGKGGILHVAIGECEAHCRHHVSGETIWFMHGPQWAYAYCINGPRKGGVMPVLLEKCERERGRMFGGFGGKDPAPGVAIDFVPVSDKACRQFFFVMKTKKIETWETEWSYEKWKTPSGFAASGWKVTADERNPETIDSAFVEDFYVFKRKADYYFVTQSGKLYVSPPPKKGEKSRTMKALWEDEKRPIVAVIEDADNDKVWLFAKDKNAGAKLDFYFEMETPKDAKTFDPAKLKAVNVDGRAKILLEYLPLINAGERKVDEVKKKA